MRVKAWFDATGPARGLLLAAMAGTILGCSGPGAEDQEGAVDDSPLAVGKLPIRGAFREMWIGPDFVRGKSDATLDPTVVDLGGFVSSANWTETAAKTSKFQFRLGFISRLFQSLPIVDRRRFGSEACVRRPGTEATFTALHQLAEILRSREIRVTVEVGGLRMHESLYLRTSSGDPSILENFAANTPSIELGVFTAMTEDHLLKCFETEFNLHVDGVVMDNPFSMTFVQQARTKSPKLNYPLYTVAALRRQITDYMSWMARARPGLFLGVTEFGLEVTGSSGRYFDALGPEKASYAARVGASPDVSLTGLLDAIAKPLGVGDARLNAFFIDSSLAWEARDRANGAQPFERILAYEAVARARGLKVGLYLESAIEDRRVCDATPHFASCGEVMHRAARCASGQVAECALTQDELVDRSGRAYAAMTLDEIDESLGSEVSGSMLSYLDQYFRRGGNPSYLNFETWHPFPERIANESTKESWLALAARLGRKIAPFNPPPATSSAQSDLYRLPGSIWLIDRVRNSTCVFPDYATYQTYLRAHGLSNPELPIFGNPPSKLTYAGRCE